MSIGVHEWRMVKEMEEVVDRMGFKLCSSSYSSNTLALRPKEGHWLAYNKDIDITAGTLQELRAFIAGIHAAHMYDGVIKISSDEKRKKAELKYFNLRKQQEIVNILNKEEEPPF